MLTKLTIENFKRFRHAEIELGEAVVFIGPNNSGKTSALQALALWHLGARRWHEKRGGKATPKKRPGVTINRRDLISLPVPGANLLWRDLHVRDVDKDQSGKLRTTNVRITITVEGVSRDKAWKCALEFDYANEESVYCRPVRPGGEGDFPPLPDAVPELSVAFLPPMSGLSANETRLDPGAIAVRIGEGRTAEVLRNLCHILYVQERPGWERVVARIQDLFGCKIERPTYVPERGEIEMTYLDEHDSRLDISSAGRGLHQSLLLLAYLESNPKSLLLLDEPDAHLEILRQRETYQLLTDVAREQGSQIIAASHSEVILNEAAGRDVVVAFVGKPHRIDGRAASQVRKALKEIGFEAFYQAEVKGWVLYLEGATDLAILKAFAATLKHSAATDLNEVFVEYVGNQPQRARFHFFGLMEAKSDMVGVAIFDQTPDEKMVSNGLVERMWSRREIENYLCYPEVLRRFALDSAEKEAAGPLFLEEEKKRHLAAMDDAIGALVPPVALSDPSDSFWKTTKASEDFLDRIFERYFKSLGLPNLMRKSDYHVLAGLVPFELVDQDVVEMMDAISAVAARAMPLRES